MTSERDSRSLIP